ncbi:MAG TPA: 23S rRNA (guanosine(2251)-2'-O)-methyltransferase RlmB [Acidimicrobiales bacterium]|nr:23S rRNA (guanosine(2251)-2'-O)-methyltransferase RlmB [Acidimicrobiales bacterium]
MSAAGGGRRRTGRPSRAGDARQPGRTPRAGDAHHPGRAPRPGDARKTAQRRPRPPVDDRVTVEGRQAVRELLRARRRRVHEVLVAESAAESGTLQEILELAVTAGVPVRRVGRPQLEARAATDAPQGVVASADPLPEASLEQLLRAPAPLLVVLDGVTDPHNLGAVMRSALCAGATGLVVGRHRSAAVGPVVTKAAAGAAEWLPVATVAGVPAALAELRAAGVWTVGLDAGAAGSLWDLAVATEPVALVLGAEGSGLGRLTRQRCEVVVGVPLQGPLDSLNVSAAATLACFEVARRRAGALPR